MLRIVNMRGVNLNVFDFDYDLTWMSFFLNADEHVYSRFGGRSDRSAEEYLTLPGLKKSMKRALAAYKKEPNAKPARKPDPPLTAESYPSAKRLKADACIHCHQVTVFQRDELRAQNKWTRNDLWNIVYPQPARLGLTLNPDEGNRVKSVEKGSAAEKAGVAKGERIESVEGQPVYGFADIQYQLHRLSAEPGKVTLEVRTGGNILEKRELELPKDWKKSDISWRAFMWGLEPAAAVHGKDLTNEEKKKLGLDAKRLAFRQGNFVPPAAQRAGIKQNDIILGIDGKELEMTMLQFNAWIRLQYEVGDKITYNILRNGEKMEIPFTLPKTGQ